MDLEEVCWSLAALFAQDFLVSGLRQVVRCLDLFFFALCNGIYLVVGLSMAILGVLGVLGKLLVRRKELEFGVIVVEGGG